MALRLDLISILGAAFYTYGSNYAFVRAGEVDETTSPIVRLCRFEAIICLHLCICTYVNCVRRPGSRLT